MHFKSLLLVAYVLIYHAFLILSLCRLLTFPPVGLAWILFWGHVHSLQAFKFCFSKKVYSLHHQRIILSEIEIPLTVFFFHYEKYPIFFWPLWLLVGNELLNLIENPLCVMNCSFMLLAFLLIFMTSISFPYCIGYCIECLS